MIDSRKFISSFIGEYDELEKMISFLTQDSTTHPAHDILKYRMNEKNNDERFEIVVALPGFDRKDVMITTEANKLKIAGSLSNDLADRDYLYKGIPRGNFTKSFTLSPNMNVVGAKMENGLLIISLMKKIPEEMKEKQIEIG